MGVKWTTATIVKQYLKGAGTSLTDTEIENFINMNEGLIEGLLKIPGEFVFDSNASRHGTPPFAIRKMVTLMTALDILASTPQSLQSFTAIDSSMQILTAQWNELLSKVNTSDFMDYIRNVEA